MKRLFKEFLVYGVSGALSKIIMVFLVPLYTRILSTGEYGVLGIASTVLGALNILCELQLTSAVGRFYFEEVGDSRRRLVGTGFVAILGLSAGTSLVVAAAAGWLGEAILASPEHAGVFHLLALQTPASVAYAYLLYLQRLARRPSKYLACSVSATLTTVGVSVLLVAVLRLGVYGALWGQVAGTVVGVTLCAAFSRHDVAWAWDWSVVRRLLAFGLPSVPAVVGTWVQAALGQFLLLSRMSLADVGVYSLSLRLASVVSLYQMAFGLAWFPFAMSIMGDPGRDRKYALGLLAYLSAGVALVVPLVLLGPEIVAILAGPDFRSAGRTLGMVSLAVLGEGVVITGSLGIMIRKRTIYYSIAYAVSVLVNVAVMMATLDRLGIVAVALGLLAGRWVHAAIVVVVSQRLLPVPHHVRQVGFILLVAFGVAAFAQAFPDLGIAWKAALAAGALGLLLLVPAGLLPKNMALEWLAKAGIRLRERMDVS